jgi:[protein-PII] uridylyltransferase
MVEKCRMLTEARGGMQDFEYSILIDITTSVQGLLAHPELIEGIENSLESVRRRDAIALTEDPMVIERIQHAAAVYVLAHEPDTIVRHAALIEPAPRSRTVRINVYPTAVSDEWEIDIATRDMRGLLARICATFAERGLEIVNADLATWPDGAVLDSFTVRSTQKPSATQLVFEVEQRLRKRIENPRRLARGTKNSIDFTLDNEAHPWHSVVLVRGADQPGFIQAVAAAFARANINVHHAKITTNAGEVADRFEVSTRHGRKISDQALRRVNALLS